MNFDEMNSAVNEAQDTIRLADKFVDKMASLIAGRLRAAGVSGYVLSKFKRELANYNIHTGKWKD